MPEVVDTYPGFCFVPPSITVVSRLPRAPWRGVGCICGHAWGQLFDSHLAISTISLSSARGSGKIQTSKSDPEVHPGRCAARSHSAVSYPFLIYELLLPPTITLPSNSFSSYLIYR